MTDGGFFAAQQLLALGRPEAALDKLDESFQPEEPLCWWLRAVALFELARPADALEACHDGLRLEPESTLLLAVAARCHIALNDLSSAEAAALGALRIDAEDADLLALYALIVAKAGQLGKASKLIGRARRFDPENASALRIEAALAAADGDDREAILRSRELLAIDPEDPHANAFLGGVLHDRGAVDEAGAHLRNAVMFDPRDRDVAEFARENLVWRHWAMWPLRPIQKYGIAPVWLCGVGAMVAAAALGNDRVTTALFVAWVSYCVYSWIVPPLVRRWLRA